MEKISKAAKTAGTNFGSFVDIYAMLERNRNRLYALDETAMKIEYLTGYTLDELLDKFAAGWELVAPDGKTLSMGDLMKGD